MNNKYILILYAITDKTKRKKLSDICLDKRKLQSKVGYGRHTLSMDMVEDLLEATNGKTKQALGTIHSSIET